MRRWLTIVFIQLSLACAAQAPYHFYHLFLDKGLSDARVTDIVQDRYGFMWFGTPNGLNRYDGYSIKTFYARKDGGLPSSAIISLYASRRGELWIGTAAGVVRYDFAKERFLYFDTSYKDAAEMNRGAISDFEEDREGNIYVASANGIYRFGLKEQRWENLNNWFRPKGAMRRVRRLKLFSDEILFGATSGNLPLYRVQLKQKTYDSISMRYLDKCCPNMYGIEKINERELMGGTLSYGAVKVDAHTKAYTAVAGVLGASDSIRYNSVYDILKDSRGRIWLASFYFGLAEYLPGPGKIVTFEQDPFSPYGFNSNSAVCVYEDYQHNIWVGTAGKGVYRFNPDITSGKFYSGNDFVPGALHSGSVLSLVTIDSNTLFAGTEKGPSFYNYKTAQFTNFKGLSITGIDGPLEFAQAALPDRDGRYVWIGSNRLGLTRYDRKTGRFRNFSRVTKPHALEDDGITDLLQLPDGNLFLVGYGNPGIFNTKTFQYFSIRNDSTSKVFSLKNLSSICLDGGGMIWLSTLEGGLYSYHPQRNELTDRSGMVSSVRDLNAIYKVAWQNGTLYLGTNKGLVLIKDMGPARLYEFKNADNADNALNEVRGVLPDGPYAWICNSRLLARLELATGKITSLGEREGLADVQLFPRTLTKSPKGRLLIGSNRGFYEISGDAIRDNATSAAPYLTGFRVHEQPLATTEAISGLKSIRLNWDQNFFSFDISAFNYIEADDMEYAYMLEGFDKDWQYIGKGRKGSYTNVPGGNYVLRLKARNASGEWNESGQRVEVRINRHFTKTGWFWALVFLAGTGIVYLIYRIRVQRINTEARLRSNYEIKLNELENSALRTQMNPHFIFNSLNTINSFISRNETAQAHQYISKFSRLIRYILDHSRQRKILLSDELEVLNLYIQIERIRFENKFDYSIQVADDIDASTIELPPLIIQPFVENAILHGLLPLPHKGFLNISITRAGDLLLCTVEDNGIGRAKARSMKKDYLTKHKSHGIDITLKRIALFNKEHGKEASVQIDDLPSGGTTVSIPVAWEESF
jgi:ligand-binding sensor domain-containing protein